MKSITFPIIVLLFCTLAAKAQQEQIWISGAGNEDTLTVSVGDIVELELRIGTVGTQISGFQAFMTFPEDLAETVPYNESPNGWFMNANLFPGTVIFADDHDSRQGMNPLPGNQLDWCYQTAFGNPRPVYTANGIAARFQIRFLRTISNYQITFNHDNPNFRNTLFWAGQSAEELPFFMESSLVLNVVGVEFGPLPDVQLTSSVPRDSVNLMPYVEEYEGFDPADVWFSWQPLGVNDVCVTDSLRDGDDYWLIFDTAGDGRRIDFQVSAHALSLTPMDTMTVFRGDTPVIDAGVGEQNPFLFWNEDERDSLWLDNYVVDLDDHDSTLVWSVLRPELDSISVEITGERLARFISPPDWHGTDTLWLQVEDPGGLRDTSRVICEVFPLNDAPVLEEQDQVEVNIGLARVIHLDEITTDIDNSYAELVWTIEGDTTLMAARIDDLARTLTLEVQAGTALWSEISFQLRVEDPDLAWDEIPLNTVVSSYPPIWIPLGERAMLTGGTMTIPLNDNVSDQDNPDSELQIWVEEAYNLETTLEASTHNLQIHAQLGWTGVEDLVLWARDPDDNANSDTLRVIVLQGGQPLVTLVPDLVFLPGETQTLLLDRYVWDMDSPDDLMTWDVVLIPSTAFQSTLDQGLRTIEFTAPMTPGIVETAVYHVQDNQGNVGEDTGSLAVIDPSGNPLILPIDEIWMNISSVDSSVVLDDFVYDHDDEVDELQWNIGTGSLVNGFIRSQDRRLFVTSFQNAGTEQLSLTVTDPDQQSGHGTVIVHVNEGTAPVVSTFAPRFVIAGQNDTLHALSNWVYDEDEGDIISWSFIPPAESPLQVNYMSAQDMAVIQTDAGHIGLDEVLAIAQDQAQNSDTESIEIYSLENLAPSLELGLLPNPAMPELVDFTVMCNEPLRTLEALLVSDSTSLGMQALLVSDPEVYLWRTRLGSLLESGIAETIRVRAVDLPDYPQVSGNETLDSLVFTTGLFSPGLRLPSPDRGLELSWHGEESRGRWFILEDQLDAGTVWTLQGPANGQLRSSGTNSLEIERAGVWEQLGPQAGIASGTRLRLAGSDDHVFPLHFGLGNPLPNPFNPAVRLPLVLLEKGHVRLEIHDLLGRHVRLLVDEELEAGQHTEVWNGRNNAGHPVASGLYLARLQQDGAQSVVKLMLLR